MELLEMRKRDNIRIQLDETNYFYLFILCILNNKKIYKNKNT